MAQLIKLNDYVSRYESDLSRYTSLFVRLKARRWKSMLEEETNKQGSVPLQEKSGGIEADFP